MQNQTHVQIDTSIRLDNLRFILSFFVVGIHTNLSTTNTSVLVTTISIALDVLYRTAVPGFFILAGFLILDSADVSWNYARKRINRILLPWFAWSILYLILRITAWNQQISVISAIRCFIIGDTFYHLWFMYRLFNIYLVAPVFGIFVRFAGIAKVTTFTIAAFAVNILYGDVANLLSHLLSKPLQSAICIPGIDNFVILLLAGWCIRHTKLSGKSFYLWLTLFILTFLAAFTLTASRSLPIGKLDETAYYQSLVIPMSVSFFILMAFHAPTIVSTDLIKRLGELSFGIYLSHPLILYILQTFDIPLFDQMPLFPTIIVFTVSASLVFFLKRIPGISHCV